MMCKNAMALFLEIAYCICSIKGSPSSYMDVKIEPNSRIMTVPEGVNSTVEFIANVQCVPRCQTRWYNWRYENISSVSSFSKKSKYDATENGQETKLKIHHVELEDFGYYKLEVSNADKKRIEHFDLIVEAKPIIHSFVSVCWYKLNTTVEPTYTITGYPLPKVVWTWKICNNYPTCKDGEFEPIPTSMVEETPLSTGLLLKISFKTNDIILIRCEASNPLGSENATVTFVPLPTRARQSSILSTILSWLY